MALDCIWHYHHCLSRLSATCLYYEKRELMNFVSNALYKWINIAVPVPGCLNKLELFSKHNQENWVLKRTVFSTIQEWKDQVYSFCSFWLNWNVHQRFTCFNLSSFWRVVFLLLFWGWVFWVFLEREAVHGITFWIFCNTVCYVLPYR